LGAHTNSMPAQVISRHVESRAVDDFLASLPSGPSALVVEGEAGIGKTTVWLAALERAQELGFRVLSSRTAAAESVLAYASLAALLDGVEQDTFDGLPLPQRLAIDRVLLRVSADGPATDQRAVAAGFLSVLEVVAEESPVVVAIDDLQWVDQASMIVVASAVRRLVGPVSVLATVRTGPDSRGGGSWLELRRPDRLRRLHLPPLSAGALHTVLSARLGRPFPRPKMLKIHEVSGGNPFYALELARAMGQGGWDTHGSLPSSLAELVRARIGGLTAETQRALLAAACLATPTLELVAQANNTDVADIEAVLQTAEDEGIVEIHGNSVRFAHPLLSRAVSSDAAPARRREMHRRLAEIVAEPELKARHLALGVARADRAILQSLDEAAEMAVIRGAPAAAAELLDLAIGLGGDTPQRRIMLAGCLLNSGDGARAVHVLEEVVATPAPPTLRAEALNLLAVRSQLEDSLLDGADQLERALADAGDDLALRVRILVSLSWVQVRLGRFDASRRRIEEAVADATRLGQSQLLGQAVGMRVVVRVLLGDGLDDQSLHHALTLEEPQAISVMFRPTFQNAMVLAWTGQLDAAHRQFVAVRQSCIERGEESELVFVSFHGVLNEIWRADFAHATLIAEDTMERAQQLDGPLQVSAALTARAMVAAYAGRASDVRRDVSEAIGPVSRSGSELLKAWTVAALGFVEVSLGNYQAAITAYEPLLAAVMTAPNATEIFVAGFVPDAAEGMIQLGRLDDAERLIELLEANGRRLDRAWMLAVGGRCRAMLLAARGDVEAAGAAALRALVEHDRLPMPFERARTQLLQGQLQRRLRQREAASVTLRAALAAFEDLGTPLWAERVHAELHRAGGIRTRAELTASERRVAELAASGITNREMAAALFISPKTVEANLSRIYRKLNIHSRAELGRHMSRPDG
jgi:DNA-binding CsgD family transcriptional regulator